MDDLNTSNFRDYIGNLDVNQLLVYRAAIDSLILDKSSKSSPAGTLNAADNSKSSIDLSIPRDVNDFVQYSPARFIDSDTEKLLSAELESLNFVKKTSKDEIQNAFISSTAESYDWKSSKGPIVNRAINIDSFPVLKSVLDKLNSENDFKLNSALVSYYKDGKVCARLHDDNEGTMDQSQPICVLSLGAQRQVEFVFKGQESFRSNVLAVTPENASLYIMKAGTQDFFKHRVRKNKNIKGDRISISFRCFLGHNAMSNAIPNPPVTPVVMKPGIVQTSTPYPQEAPSMAFSHFSGHHDDSLRSSNAVHSEKADYRPNEKLCLLFGSSITEGVVASKISRGNRTVVNLSSTGFGITDVEKAAADFCYENPISISKVDKVIINVGTNEVKHFNSYYRKISDYFWGPLCKLVQKIKQLFYNAQIIFQSVLPIKIIFTYNIKSIHLFNRLLINICERYGCIFHDCFGLFLDHAEWDINYSLYSRKGIHLNERGLGVLCRALKYVIYHNVYNPQARTPFLRFYPY